MYTPAVNMDFERCQDLSELAWFEGAPSWPAAESRIETTVMTVDSYGQVPLISIPYGDIDYSINDIAKQSYYNLARTDSLEELKSLAVAAPMEVVPMQRREALAVQNIVKIEKEDFDVAREEEVPIKEDLDEFKMEPDEFELAFDSQELLQELGDGDLVNYIISDPPPQLPSPVEEKSPLTSSPPTYSPSPTPSPVQSNAKAVRETYLAIPREITAGTSDSKKLPKMLILKTSPNSDLTTINLDDVGMTIAERIKTIGKRQRPKRYSEAVEDSDDNVDDDDDDEDDVDYNDKFSDKDEDYLDDHPKPRKRARRTSTTSSMCSSVDKYRELRDKNNEASRRSRQNRKEKERGLMKSKEDAERKNAQLKARADELEKLVHSFRKILLQVVLNRQSQS